MGSLPFLGHCSARRRVVKECGPRGKGTQQSAAARDNISPIPNNACKIDRRLVCSRGLDGCDRRLKPNNTRAKGFLPSKAVTGCNLITPAASIGALASGWLPGLLPTFAVLCVTFSPQDQSGQCRRGLPRCNNAVSRCYDAVVRCRRWTDPSMVTTSRARRSSSSAVFTTTHISRHGHAPLSSQKLESPNLLRGYHAPPLPLALRVAHSSPRALLAALFLLYQRVVGHPRRLPTIAPTV